MASRWLLNFHIEKGAQAAILKIKPPRYRYHSFSLDLQVKCSLIPNARDQFIALHSPEIVNMHDFLKLASFREYEASRTPPIMS